MDGWMMYLEGGTRVPVGGGSGPDTPAGNIFIVHEPLPWAKTQDLDEVFFVGNTRLIAYHMQPRACCILGSNPTALLTLQGFNYQFPILCSANLSPLMPFREGG